MVTVVVTVMMMTIADMHAYARYINMHLRDSWGRESDSCCTDCTQN